MAGFGAQKVSYKWFIGSAGLQTYRTIVLTNAAAAATTAPAMLPNSKHKQS